MRKARVIKNDLGPGLDGYGRPLADPANEAFKALCSGAARSGFDEYLAGATTTGRVLDAEGISGASHGDSLGEDVPDNGFIRRHLEEGYVLLSYRTTDKEEAKAEADAHRKAGKKAVYVTLKKPVFGVFVKER